MSAAGGQAKGTARRRVPFSARRRQRQSSPFGVSFLFGMARHTGGGSRRQRDGSLPETEHSAMHRRRAEQKRARRRERNASRGGRIL